MIFVKLLIGLLENVLYLRLKINLYIFVSYKIGRYGCGILGLNIIKYFED